jgi:hypothetical protein
MRRAPLTTLAIVAAGLIVGMFGCDSSEPSPTPVVSRATTTGMPPSFPASALRVDGVPEVILAEGNHGIELTLGEYNSRVGEVLMDVTLDTLVARSMTLNRLVFHKVVAAEGRLRGYSAPQAGNSLQEEIEIARRVMEDGIKEAQHLSDDDAREYFNAHRDKFPKFDPGSLESSGEMLHVKFTMYDERWRQQIEEWMRREEVVVHLDRFEAMSNPSSNPSNSQTEESRL